MENLNLNIDSQNLDQCLKEICNFGGTTYQNICTGQSNYVQWGSVDWLGGIILVALGICFVVMVFSIVVAMIKMVFDY